jgi:hypothetical protein
LISVFGFYLGFVHITEKTHSLLKADEFEFEDGPPYVSSNGGKYLI